MALLEAEALGVRYGDIRALSGVSLHLERGELVSVIGANGAGKSSLLGAIMGLVPLAEGCLRFNGQDVTRWPAFRRARAGMRLVPERARVFPRLSVRENLLAGVVGLRHRLPLRQRLQWLHQLFPILEQRAHQLANTLSGGEQQQLAIARALISSPQLLLVDEVSMGLMPKLAEEVFSLLQRLNREEGLTILLVEQNAVASLAISQRAYVLETGHLTHQGTAAELACDPGVQAAYLGGDVHAA
jgi:branched-chain amino acid transport system ATP-binding protein